MLLAQEVAQGRGHFGASLAEATVGVPRVTKIGESARPTPLRPGDRVLTKDGRDLRGTLRVPGTLSTWSLPRTGMADRIERDGERLPSISSRAAVPGGTRCGSSRSSSGERPSPPRGDILVVQHPVSHARLRAVVAHLARA